MIIEKPAEFRSNLVTKFNKIIKRKKISITLEKAIYNWSIRHAKKKMIVRKWDNQPFVQIYLDRVHSIYLNINPKSYIGNKKIVKEIVERNHQKEGKRLKRPQTIEKKNQIIMGIFMHQKIKI